MLLDRQKLQTILGKERKSAYLPFSLHILETVSSTNHILWDLIDQGAEPGCVVIATQQTAGKGQWGHQWISSTGGLYLSLAIDPQQLPAKDSYQLTLASAWGVTQQLRNCGINLAIKWPNDVVLCSDLLKH